ncbi:hypothetical protein TNCV_3175511 [Trichonephila clavipes]|nr:hypothetical protein TNCV_3175511 [Trichonephila clavipes]
MACDCGFQMLNDDEIVTSVQKSDHVDSETDEDEDNNNESSEGPSNADAFSALDTAMECVRFHILHGSHSVFGYPNGVWVPVDSDKRRSTASAPLRDEYLVTPGAEPANREKQRHLRTLDHDH